MLPFAPLRRPYNATRDISKDDFAHAQVGKMIYIMAETGCITAESISPLTELVWLIKRTVVSTGGLEVWDSILDNVSALRGDVYNASPQTVTYVHKVTHYNEEKGFGFVEGNTFFHIREGHQVEGKGDGFIHFTGPIGHPPKKGDVIRYEIQSLPDGRRRCLWWTYELDCQKIVEEEANKLPYRLVRRGDETILWEGMNIGNFRLLYPLSIHKANTCWDTSLYRIDMFACGKWVETTDPR